ncbi:PTS system, mannose-specific IIA component/PTS system, fructoselysine and glucoselysine-specific IIA component [Chitinophaga costaii]|uniref:PTS system, mannose-specific IIA component/PTS system, fructoselysine and glucoselysine-specific IIA component n=1 Tax=Chitinophaga costaii TaxID=1335309 RepID=A0A1C4CLI6_9BACT|nr:PTS mannose transporter subunit IIAB [Chitinophaga costaii]SCC19913.1 PTS system, mannose-specific IIA component/PTS system, fructoselysine and glucoselysine-specific IIA component [Chitinophaga costaii]
MERKFIIATHGHFATGVKSSLDIIIGETSNITLITAYTDGNEGITKELDAALQGLAANEELIIFTDLLGGSITNQVLQQALRERVHIVAGFNLALLLEIMMADTDTPTATIIGEAITHAREQLVYVNNLIPER